MQVEASNPGAVSARFRAPWTTAARICHALRASRTRNIAGEVQKRRRTHRNQHGFALVIYRGRGSVVSMLGQQRDTHWKAWILGVTTGSDFRGGALTRCIFVTWRRSIHRFRQASLALIRSFSRLGRVHGVSMYPQLRALQNWKADCYCLPCVSNLIPTLCAGSRPSFRPYEVVDD